MIMTDEEFDSNVRDIVYLANDYLRHRVISKENFILHLKDAVDVLVSLNKIPPVNFNGYVNRDETPL